MIDSTVKWEKEARSSNKTDLLVFSKRLVKTHAYTALYTRAVGLFSVDRFVYTCGHPVYFSVKGAYGIYAADLDHEPTEHPMHVVKCDVMT